MTGELVCRRDSGCNCTRKSQPSVNDRRFVLRDKSVKHQLSNPPQIFGSTTQAVSRFCNGSEESTEIIWWKLSAGTGEIPVADRYTQGTRLLKRITTLEHSWGL